MSLEARLREQLLPIVPVVKPQRYDGDALEYIVLRITVVPDLHAESQPRAFRCLVSVHWYLPLRLEAYPSEGINPLERKKQIASAIRAAGCTWPSIEDASDDNGQHYVFECEGMDDYGPA